MRYGLFQKENALLNLKKVPEKIKEFHLKKHDVLVSKKMNGIRLPILSKKSAK